MANQSKEPMIKEQGSNGLFELALEESAVKHFCKLFEVLMTDPHSDAAFTRFETGLDNLIEVSSKVDEMIKSKYGRLVS